MTNNICIPQSYFLILFIFIILLNILYFYYNNLKNDSKTIVPSSQETIIKLPIEQLIINTSTNPPNLHEKLDIRDRRVINDQLTAPERRVDVRQYPRVINDLINISTRGYPDNYQLLGIVSRKSDEKILQLYGRQIYPNSNQYEYYVITENNGFMNKIPIGKKGNREIEDGDIIIIDEFDKNKGSFQVKLYNYNTPRYNPYIFD